MDWLAFAGSIIGGLIGGLFTFMGVKATLKHEEQSQRKVENLKIQDERPRLELISYKDINDTKDMKSTDLDAVFLAIKNVKIDSNGQIGFFYNNACLDSSNLVCVEYVFKNTGKTEIDFMTVCSNFPKTTSLIPLERRNIYINENLLNYAVDSSKRFIKPNDSVTVRIYYCKNEIIPSKISASLILYMQDINGRYWRQPLFAPSNETDNSRLVSFKDYKSSCDIDIAIKCFKGEMYW